MDFKTKLMITTVPISERELPREFYEAMASAQQAVIERMEAELMRDMRRWPTPAAVEFTAAWVDEGEDVWRAALQARYARPAFDFRAGSMVS